jgi:hypothetical protein
VVVGDVHYVEARVFEAACISRRCYKLVALRQFYRTFLRGTLIDERAFEISEDDITRFEPFKNVVENSLAVFRWKHVGRMGGTHHNVPYSDDDEAIIFIVFR